MGTMLNRVLSLNVHRAHRLSTGQTQAGHTLGNRLSFENYSVLGNVHRCYLFFRRKSIYLMVFLEGIWHVVSVDTGVIVKTASWSPYRFFFSRIKSNSGGQTCKYWRLHG